MRGLMKGLRGHGNERASRAGLVERRAPGSASAWSWVRLRAIARKEALQVRRDPACPACADENRVPALVEYDDACRFAGSVPR